MKKSFKLPTLIIACAVCAALAFAGAFVFFEGSFGGSEGYALAKKYAELAGIIDERYIGESSAEDVSDAALSAMVSSLDDNWSYYMTAEEYESYRQYASNSYTGIGVTVEKDEETGGLLISAVTEGSPAETAGLAAGDIILAVDGEDITGYEISESRSLIRSKGGQTLELFVRRAAGGDENVSVECGEVKVNPVSYEMLENSIGYIKITNFEQGSAEGAQEAVEALREQGAAALIFDVRSNPGGKVSELTKLLDHLLPEGDIFVSVDEDGNETVTTSDADCVEMPMAVLVNADSYSAAELFAETLREYDWAEVVGESTTGKGRSQVTIELSDGSAVHLSTKVYLTPDRLDLSETGGIVPDYEVALDSDYDSQLAEAAKILS